MYPSRILFALFCFGLFVALVTFASMRTTDFPNYEYLVQWLRQTVGLFIATIGALMVLGRCADDRPVDDLVGPAIGFLCGALLLTQSWAAAGALGLSVSAAIVKQIWRQVGKTT